MRLGDYRVEVIPDAELKLDGGAMFGVVPRVVWERECPADSSNRIRMAMNCVLIKTPSDRILIETGIGEKWSPRQIEMYGIERTRPLADSLREIAGCGPEDITIVVNTHLHFDHAGGNTVPRPGSGPNEAFLPQFPNARYLVSKSELDHAKAPHERDRASYLAENWRPLIASGQLEMMPDDYEAVPGLRLMTERGHSETMQTWRLDRGGETMFGFADLIPMTAHLRLPWIAGFDLYPVETLEFKRRILPIAAAENWMCLFYHDIKTPLCRLMVVEDKMTTIPV